MIHRIAATALAAACSIGVTDAFAVAQRTFVSTAGNDANTVANCSLVAPCRSFGSAMTVTATNGEIVVLDSGGYGRVTIDRSVTIAAPSGVFAGISVFPGTNGIDILTPDILVVLRGLTINGQGGNKGVNAPYANVHLAVEGCVISNLGALNSYGIFVDSAGGDVSIKDSILRNNTTGMELTVGRATMSRLHVERSVHNGIQLYATKASLSESTISGNGGHGVLVTGSGGDHVLTISDASIVGNVYAGVGAEVFYSSSQFVAITRSTLAENGWEGAFARLSGAGAIRMEVGASTVKSNGLDGLAMFRTSGTAASVLTATGNLISGNGGAGLYASGNDIYAIATRNTITMNAGVGFSQSASAVVETAQDNVLRGNNAGLAQTSGTITPFGWQ